MSFNLKKNNMDETGEHYAKWNKPDTEEKRYMIPLTG